MPMVTTVTTPPTGLLLFAGYSQAMTAWWTLQDIYGPGGLIDIVIHSGEKAYSYTIEQYPTSIPGLESAATTATPNARLGAIVAAFF